MSRRLLVAFAVLVSLLVAGGTDPAVADEEARPALEAIQKEVEHVEHLLEKRASTNADLKAWLRIVTERYPSLEGEQGADVQDDIAELLIEGLDLVRLDGEVNERVEVNVLAASLLGSLADHFERKRKRRLDKRVRRMLERLDRARYTVDEAYVESLAALLARLGSEKSLRFLKDEYMRTEERQVPYIVATMKAIPLFPSISPEMRHALLEEAVVRYAPLETAAATSSTSTAVLAKRRVWDRIRIHVIEMMQHVARTPVDEEGRALNTVRQFQSWLREHDDPRAAPWTVASETAN